MRDEFKQYLAALGMAQAFSERIDETISFGQFLCPDEITGLFVSDYRENDGTRVFPSLMMFSDRHVLEAKQFAKEDNVDIIPLKDNLVWIELKKENYDLQNATENSKFFLTGYFATDVGQSLSFSLKGTGENCDYLAKIFRAFIEPNLKR
jgi:hypothetical protein